MSDNETRFLVLCAAILISLPMLSSCIPSPSAFNVILKILTPSGNPIVRASVKVGGINAGLTGGDGSVTIAQLLEGSYAVSVTWYGKDVSPATPLVVWQSGIYVLTATKIAHLQVQVVGAQNQGLGASSVTITPTGTTTPIFTGVCDANGLVTVEVPHGSYDVKASSRGVEATATVMVTGDTLQKITTGIFIEILGQGLTFAGFLLWAIGGLVVVVAIFVLVLLYLRSQKRETQLPPPPPAQ